MRAGERGVGDRMDNEGWGEGAEGHGKRGMRMGERGVGDWMDTEGWGEGREGCGKRGMGMEHSKNFNIHTITECAHSAVTLKVSC